MRSWKRSVSMAAMVMIAAACGGEGGGEGDSSASGPGAGRRAEREKDESPGATLYRGSCIMCHGERGAGTQLGPPLAGAGRAAEQVAAAVRDGVPTPQTYPVPMPPRGNGSFDDEEIRTVSEYVTTLAR
jgi:mono/diheme cytochrome c family protein